MPPLISLQHLSETDRSGNGVLPFQLNYYWLEDYSIDQRQHSIDRRPHLLRLLAHFCCLHHELRRPSPDYSASEVVAGILGYFVRTSSVAVSIFVVVAVAAVVVSVVAAAVAVVVAAAVVVAEVVVVDEGTLGLSAALVVGDLMLEDEMSALDDGTDRALVVLQMNPNLNWGACLDHRVLWH